MFLIQLNRQTVAHRKYVASSRVGAYSYNKLLRIVKYVASMSVIQVQQIVAHRKNTWHR